MEILRGAIEYIETLEDLLHGSNGSEGGNCDSVGSNHRDFLRDPGNAILHSNAANSILMVSHLYIFWIRISTKCVSRVDNFY